jgi:glucose/arabinose dehydrogenase
VFPIVLTEPGPVFASAHDLIPGVLEVWATGVRNGFGLTFHQGELYLTDQGSDGGAAPPPAQGVPGFGPNFGPDHLHRVTRGAFLGQPNQARHQLVLNDGSSYVSHVDSPGYVPPVHYFGIHNSATGIATYHGALFPELEGRLLVAKFSGSLGAQALDIDGDRVTVTVIAGLRRHAMSRTSRSDQTARSCSPTSGVSGS